MYLALREFKFARGRFSLIVAVVALMTLLVGFLTGIAGGLAGQNISALLRTGADQVVFAAPTADRKMSYAESTISATTAAQWSEVAGVRVTPLSIVNAAAEANGTKKVVALFAGVDPDGAAMPSGADIVLGAETAAFALGAVVSSSNIPFVSGVLPVLIPGVLMIIAGLLGALVSLRQIVKADPNTALQASGG